MDNKKLMMLKLRELNGYIEVLDQSIEIEPKTHSGTKETYYDLYWIRKISRNEGLKELVFGGNEFEIYIILTGIEYGIRMQNHKYISK